MNTTSKSKKDASKSPSRRGKKLLKISLAVTVSVAVLAVLIGAWVFLRMRASLPLLEGEIKFESLAGPVTIERDGLGIPTLRAQYRNDVYAALGFLHAQDRFFQMDLQRRVAAGELAALFGRSVLNMDLENRKHRFRSLGKQVIDALPPFEKAALNSYTQGVNLGLQTLGNKPPEYVVLRTEPKAWLPEDCILVIYAMFMQLEYKHVIQETTAGTMRDHLPEPLFQFMAQRGSSWDELMSGDSPIPVPLPGPAQFHLRDPGKSTANEGDDVAPRRPAGSNNWAVSGALSRHQSAMLAADMHLEIGLPNIWYRARLIWPDTQEELQITGITLPGIPGIISGSNGKLAWGYTNAMTDALDLIQVKTDPANENHYLTPRGSLPFQTHPEVIQIKGGQEQKLDIQSTIWGPIISPRDKNQLRALRWVAHDPQVVNLGYLKLETATTAEQALQIAALSGMPSLNLVAADASGQIGWTLTGKIPKRSAYNSGVPGDWSDGTRNWQGWLEPGDYPKIINPVSGRIWTANARVLGEEWDRQIGNAWYELGARAKQIKGQLFAKESFSERDMLAIQLDDRAIFLQRWQTLLLDLLDEEAISSQPVRAEARKLVSDWGGRATVDSVGFRLVRSFRLFVMQNLFRTITAACREADSNFNVYNIPHLEAPLWALVNSRPPHLLPPPFKSWRSYLLAMFDRELTFFRDRGALKDTTWGSRNYVQFQHPLGSVPLLGSFFNFPAQSLPGAPHMPRYQDLVYGATERMVVSPGHEEEGIFHMPGGQSGHPLSPFYDAGHQAWVNGEASPFLPGPTAHRLVLNP